ncbi:unnamed protein product, partial [marine sediment metagenome]
KVKKLKENIDGKENVETAKNKLLKAEGCKNDE